jgi:hypothetical protein
MGLDFKHSSRLVCSGYIRVALLQIVFVSCIVTPSVQDSLDSKEDLQDAKNSTEDAKEEQKRLLREDQAKKYQEARMVRSCHW